MIKINKGYGQFDIPASLRVPLPANFVEGRVPAQSLTTQRKRDELLAKAGYIDDDKYNRWYKSHDIRIALANIYHSKCAFCEQRSC